MAQHLGWPGARAQLRQWWWTVYVAVTKHPIMWAPNVNRKKTKQGWNCGSQVHPVLLDPLENALGTTTAAKAKWWNPCKKKPGTEIWNMEPESQAISNRKIMVQIRFSWSLLAFLNDIPLENWFPWYFPMICHDIFQWIFSNDIPLDFPMRCHDIFQWMQQVPAGS
jgi:hypothetical protein